MKVPRHFFSFLIDYSYVIAGDISTKDIEIISESIRRLSILINDTRNAFYVDDTLVIAVLYDI